MAVTVYLAPIFNGEQLYNDSGVLLAGGYINTYLANSTTPASTYTDATGTVQNANPIQLNSAGRPPQEIWLPKGQATKFIVTDKNSVPITPSNYDNVQGVNDPSFNNSSSAQWLSGPQPTYSSGTQFTALTNYTSTFTVGRRLQFTVTAGVVYGRVTSSSYNSGTTLTTVNVQMDGSQVLDSGLSIVNYSLLTSTVQAIPIRAATTSGGDAYTATVGVATYNVGDEYRIRFNQANTTTSPTLALDGLSAVSLTDNAGNAPYVGQILASGEYTVRYSSASTFEIIGGLQPAPQVITSKIQPFSATGGSTLVATLNSSALDFRSGTLSSGTVSTVSTGNLTLTIPAAATLGATASIGTVRLIFVVAYNGGSPVLCVVCNYANGPKIDETNLISPTTISSGSTSAGVFYSASSVSANSPYRVVGFADCSYSGSVWNAVTVCQGVGGEALTSLNSLGYGQIWQIPGKSTAVTYYNTTGRPIYSFVTFRVSGNNTNGSYSFSVNGVSVVSSTQSNNNASIISDVSFGVIIPPGAYYSTTVSASCSQISWFELY